MMTAFGLQFYIICELYLILLFTHSPPFRNEEWKKKHFTIKHIGYNHTMRIGTRSNKKKTVKKKEKNEEKILNDMRL